MEEWLRTKPTIGPESQVLDTTMSFQSMTSPYDVPEAFRVVKHGRGVFRIDFRYIDGPEPEGKTIDEGDALEFVLGKFTNRIIAIRVNLELLMKSILHLDACSAGSADEYADGAILSISQRLVEALDRLSERPETGGESGRIRFAQQAYRTRRDDIAKKMWDCSAH